MEVCFLLFSSYIVPVFCSRSVIMQKRNAIFVRYALAGGFVCVPCGGCAFLRVLCSCEAFRPTRFYYVTLTLNPSPRGRDLPSPCGLSGSRSLPLRADWLVSLAGAVLFCEGCALARLSRINAEKRPAPVMKPVFCFPIGYRRRPSSLMMLLYLSMSTLWR